MKRPLKRPRLSTMYNRDTFINELMKAVEMLEREMAESESHKDDFCEDEDDE